MLKALKTFDAALKAFPTKLSRFQEPHISRSLRTPVRRTDGRFITYKPITPGLRHRREVDMDALQIHQGDPVQELTYRVKRKGGRNHTGKITCRGRGGGMERIIRKIDFARLESGPQRCVRLEFDPFRSSFIALLHHTELNTLSYILAPQGLKVGDTVSSFRKGLSESQLRPEPGKANPLVQPGNFLQLQHIPLGSTIHCISLHPDGPAILCRSAGTSAVLIDIGQKGFAQVRLQSGEIRLIGTQCVAAIGSVSNPDWMHRILGKAGASRKLGRRPKVRGTAMNAYDHPHGGGEGKTKGKHPKTPWGIPCQGFRTRDKRKAKWWIVKDRRK